LPNTDEIKYAYDDQGRLVSMTDWDNQTSTFRYDKLGRHVGTQRSNGFTSKYTYNNAGHLQELRHGEGWNTAKTLQSFVYETDARGNRTQVKEVSLRDTAGSSVTMAHDDESIVYSGDWDANGSFHETIETNAKLAVMFYGNTGINLTMGTGNDCGIYDVYINQTLWQSYDGYASSAGEDVIALEVKGDGAHLLEVYQRREKNSASSGYKVRFKSLEALDAYEKVTIDYTYDNLNETTYGYDGQNELLQFLSIQMGIPSYYNMAWGRFVLKLIRKVVGVHLNAYCETKRWRIYK
jgi:YD repeat-containing protein